MIAFSAVAKRYPGGQEALRDVNFTVEAGTLAFITGRSGAGKSTLLKLIPAIERPTTGSVVVNGQNVGALKRSGFDVGVIWIQINREHFGLHGSPEPSQIGRTESHGCIRMTNWDVVRLAALVKNGTPVLLR